MDQPPALDRRIAAIAALEQPLRRELYGLLMASDGWTSRDDAATGLGVPRSVAAFHLDKLAEAGVVEVRFERTSGRRGPGAGRPSKLYRPRQEELSASVPERQYDVAGSVLADAVAASARTGAPVAECVKEAARETGRRIGDEAVAAAGAAGSAKQRRQAVVDVLAGHGYAPGVRRRGEIALTNCPFHRLAEEHRALVCGMNLELLDGVLEALGAGDELSARLAPEPGYCCVRIGT
jgi:predicted ArsR family transcriptional regulator